MDQACRMTGAVTGAVLDGGMARGQLDLMSDRWRRQAGPQLDLRPDGGFVRRPSGIPWSIRIGTVAALVALAAVGMAGAVLAFWLLMMLLPVIVVAGVVAWGAFRFQLWRARRGAAGVPTRWR